MKTNPHICLLALLLNTPLAFGQNTAFTYQGRLTDNNLPATGTYDFRGTLFDTPFGSNQLSQLQTAVPVTNGLFTVSLDFGGDVFDGGARYLQIALRPFGSTNPYVSIAPRQPITPAPYALHALDSAVPAGSVMAYMGTNAPAGWLLCDGSAVSRGTYARLFTAIGVANGSGDGFSTFNLPDLRGAFLRGVDGAAGVDPDKGTRTAAKPGGNTGNAVGSLQTDQFRSHNHANGNFGRVLQLTTGGPNTAVGGDATSGEPDIFNSAPLVSAGGNETRPRNIYVNYIIKH